MTDGRNDLTLYPHCHFKASLFAPTQMVAQALILAKYSWPRSLQSVYALISSSLPLLIVLSRLQQQNLTRWFQRAPFLLGVFFFLGLFCFSKQNCCLCKPFRIVFQKILKLKSCLYKQLSLQIWPIQYMSFYYFLPFPRKKIKYI